MNNGNGAGWALMLADLALILFIVTASHASGTAGGAGGGTGATPPIDAGPDPVPQAYYQFTPSAPPLRNWIEGQQLGADAQVRLSVSYSRGKHDDALAVAARLLGEAESAGLAPEVVLSPGRSGPVAVLTYGR